MQASPALEFDFTPALTLLDPHHTYAATPLSGGLVNLTARIAISSSTEEHECVFGSAPSSAVAKYAPPYVATLGEAAPFSQFRQVIEARALKLLSQPATHAYIHANPDSKVTTPTLIHHDTTAYVLLMTDLGPNSVTLDQWLFTEPNLELAAAVGARFGSYFARLDGVRDFDPKMDLTNPVTREVLLDMVVRTVGSNLVKCGVDATEADVLAEACMKMFVPHGKEGAEGKVFGLGDTWPRSLLVLEQNGDELAVIDWEFAGMIEPLEDIAQLAANLYILYQTSTGSCRPAIQALALALLRQHHTQAPEWYYARSHRIDAWMLLAQLFIYNLVEIDWFDGNEERRGEEIRRLGSRGAEFIRDAEQLADISAGGPIFETLFAGLQ